MKALFVHAHFDDYEFTAAGTFARWRKKFGEAFQGKVVVCTDGKAGHHFRTREETGRVRLAEQEASARIGEYLFELLRLPNGEAPREACLQVTSDLLAALWRVIREFEPDYLFCPPPAGDPLAGIHNDHETVAEAVRRVAYMINVPHAFTPEFPADEARSVPCRVPVILNVYDGYQFGANSFDLAVDVEEVFSLICEMAWCHQSQVREWLPWVGRHRIGTPGSLQEWREVLRQRFERKHRELGLPAGRACEVFRLTAWGAIPSLSQLIHDFPELAAESNLAPLAARLELWNRN